MLPVAGAEDDRTWDTVGALARASRPMLLAMRDSFAEMALAGDDVPDARRRQDYGAV